MKLNEIDLHKHIKHSADDDHFHGAKTTEADIEAKTFKFRSKLVLTIVLQLMHSIS